MNGLRTADSNTFCSGDFTVNQPGAKVSGSVALMNRFSKTRECAAALGRREVHSAGMVFTIGAALCLIPFPVCTAIGLGMLFLSTGLFVEGARDSASGLEGGDILKDALKSLGRAAIGAAFFFEIPMVLTLKHAIASNQLTNNKVVDFVAFTEQHRNYADLDAMNKFYTKPCEDFF